MLIKDIMKKEVELVDRDAPLAEAARKMRSRNIGSLPVKNGDRLAGMITGSDIVTRGLALGLDITKSNVASCMTSPILYAFEDQSVEEVTQVMLKKEIWHLPILSRKKRLLGIVSWRDLVSKKEDLSFDPDMASPPPKNQHELERLTGEGGAQFLSS